MSTFSLARQARPKDQIDIFRFRISWLAEANSTLAGEKWHYFMAWVWCNPEGWWQHLGLGFHRVDFELGGLFDYSFVAGLRV